MKKLFNQVIDINGKTCRYPADENNAAFFFAYNEKKYFIYALYTKSDLTGNLLIEINEETYLKEITKYKDTYKKEPVINTLSSTAAIKGIIAFARYKATVDNMTVEELVTLEKEENK